MGHKHGFSQPDHKTLGSQAPQVNVDPCSPASHGYLWLSKCRLKFGGCKSPLLSKNHVLLAPDPAKASYSGQKRFLSVSFIISRKGASTHRSFCLWRVPSTGPWRPGLLWSYHLREGEERNSSHLVFDLGKVFT